MEYKYDFGTDILLIKLSKEKSDFGDQKENIIIHCNKKGKPIEIEILDAKKTTLKIMKAIFEAQKVSAPA